MLQQESNQRFAMPVQCSCHRASDVEYKSKRCCLCNQAGLRLRIGEGEWIIILWHFTRCRINFEGLRGLNFEWKSFTTEIQARNRCTNKSQLIGPPAKIEPTVLLCRCNALAKELQSSHHNLVPRVFNLRSTAHKIPTCAFQTVERARN